MVYGTFILLLMLIPNPLLGRLCFLFIGGVIGAGGDSLSRGGTQEAADCRGEGGRRSKLIPLEPNPPLPMESFPVEISGRKIHKRDAKAFRNVAGKLIHVLNI